MREVDLAGVRCPMNLLQVKLALEAARPGEQLRFLFDDAEAASRVSRSTAALGHEVSLEWGGQRPVLTVRKMSSQGDLDRR